MQVFIGAGTLDASGEVDRYVRFVGEVGWPSVPPVGATWVHCGDWPGEVVYQVFYCGPGDDGEGEPGWAPVQVEIRTTDEVVQHLVERHGFTEG
jgi:hypothetical protein